MKGQERMQDRWENTRWESMRYGRVNGKMMVIKARD